MINDVTSSFEKKGYNIFWVVMVTIGDNLECTDLDSIKYSKNYFRAACSSHVVVASTTTIVVKK